MVIRPAAVNTLAAESPMPQAAIAARLARRAESG
jgi:hypothetical protein